MTENIKFKDYKKYKWFFTSSNKLVVGGKSAEQNESLVRHFVKQKCKYIVMHTKRPGSPFSIILDENPSKKDLEECAIFTASFSRGWKENRKKMMIDVFLLEQMIKTPEMKEGTFGVMDSIEHKPVILKLYLVKQNDVLRCVPFEKKGAIEIVPGKIKKEKFAKQIADELNLKIEEVLNALPTGPSNFAKKFKKGKVDKKVDKKTIKKRK